MARSGEDAVGVARAGASTGAGGAAGTGAAGTGAAGTGAAGTAGTGAGGRRADRAVGRSGTTRERILDAALAAWGTRGYEATSLDALAAGLDITKQSILYWFPSKEALLDAVVARGAEELAAALQSALDDAGGGWGRVEAVVRSVFRLAARRPELLGLVREVSRLGPPAATQMIVALQPLVHRASEFLETEMDSGHMRRHDPNLLLIAIYSTVVGMITEVDVLRALGEEPTARSLVRRRADVLAFLREALLPA